MRLEKSHVIPPVWVNGNTRALRSSGTRPRAAFMATAAAAMVASVCRAPLGSAVVPDV